MDKKEAKNESDLDKQMSFLSHLDEFRRRLIRSILVIVVAFIFCWSFKTYIYNFLSIPVRKALTEAQSKAVPLQGLNGSEKSIPLKELKKGNTVRFVFSSATRMGKYAIASGTSVLSIVEEDSNGEMGLYTNEAIYIDGDLIPKGIKLPVSFLDSNANKASTDEKLVFTTAIEPFQLYMMVSLYGAIVISMPFILFQVWGFISPALYKHERKYITPFVFLSTISFIIGAAFAYYILFPPAVGYLLALGEDFTPLLKANDYFDFIILIMLAMGVIFQMPAITYVLARIGIITATFLIKTWKIALIIMLLVAAFVSPTGDMLNMMLFATPMIVLYIVSIFIAWLFGKKRNTGDEDISY